MPLRALKKVQHILVLLAFCVALSLVSWGGRSDASPKKELIAVGGPVVEVAHSSRSLPLEWIFQLHNPTAEPITIQKVTTGCACTVASASVRVIEPGATVPLAIKITAFQTDVAEVRQKVTVDSSASKLALEIRVTLPRPSEAVHRPQRIYLDPLPGETKLTRTLGIRVPKQCGKRLSTERIIRHNCPSLEVTLAQMPPTDMYFEYQLKVILAASDKVEADAKLHLETGCNSIVIPILQSATGR